MSCPDCARTGYCGRSWTPDFEAAVDAAFIEVTNRMGRWSHHGYAGDWRDPEYDEPEAGKR